MEIKEALEGLEARINTSLKDMGTKQEAGEAVSKKALADLEAMLKDHKDIASLVDGLKTDITELKAAGAIKPAGAAGAEDKTMGRIITDSKGFAAYKSGESSRMRLEMKNTVLNSGNNTSRHAQLDGIQGAAFRRLTVMPTVDQGQTDSNIVYYSQETTWANNAAGQTEGDAKAESDWAATEVNLPVQTIAHFIRLSKQALNDSSFLASFVDRRMRHGVNNKLESQIIAGTGVGTQLSGWTKSGNHVVTSPIGTGNIFGLANAMKYEIIAADYEPDFFYMNPTDWSTVETTQRGTGDAAYVGASGAISYVNNGLTPLLWGLPVVTSNNIPAGTVICKSMDADMYLNRETVLVEMFEQNADDVEKNLVTIRAETRGVECNFAPAAIRTGLISGIT